MSETPPPIALDQTRRRLLEAAGEVFAECGYRAATTRQICQRAGANPAAINYHFGDKEALYLAVLQDGMRTAEQRYPLTMGLPENPTPQQRLEAFVRAFLFRMLDEGRPAWQGKLMVRELVEPTAVLEVLIEQCIRPQFNVLMSILSELLPPDTPPERLHRFAASIVGQCLHYRHARPVIEKLMPQQKYAVGDIEELARHITDFSLCAIRRAQTGVKDESGR